MGRSPPAGLPARRLEQLDEVAGWILDEDLRPARTGHDIVAEANAFGSQTIDLTGEVVGDEVDAVPPTGPRLGAVRHRASRGALRPAQQDAEVAPRDIGECREAAAHREPQMLGVELRRLGDIIDHVADVDRL